MVAVFILQREGVLKKMNELTEKLLLVAAGAAVGALGYMAVKHPDELKEFMGDAAELGQKFFEKTMADVADKMGHSKDAA